MPVEEKPECRPHTAGKALFRSHTKRYSGKATMEGNEMRIDWTGAEKQVTRIQLLLTAPARELKQHSPNGS